MAREFQEKPLRAAALRGPGRGQAGVTPAHVAGFGALAALLASVLLLRNSGWHGDSHLHTAMEIVGTMLAMIVGAVALVGYYSKRDALLLFVGCGFLGAGFLDGYHTVLTSEWFRLIVPSPPASLVPWSWMASRLFLPLALLAGCWACRRNEGRTEPLRINPNLVYLATSAFAFANLVLFAFASLPTAMNGAWRFARPQEFVPALLFLAALAGYWRHGDWRRDPFQRWLMLSLFVNFVVEGAFMSSSGRLYDAMFDAAHLLKIASYLCALVGLLVGIYFLFLQETERGEQIALANDALRHENSQRNLAESRLHRLNTELEQRVAARTADLELARNAANLASEAKSSFLAAMSHEIRTPMHGVLGMTELLLRTELDAKQRRFVDTVHRSGESLLTIIDDILDFSKIEAGKMVLDRVEFRLHELIDDVIALLAHSAQRKGLALVCHTARDLPHYVRGDSVRLRQILVNLVGNAVKFTKTGSVMVDAGCDEQGRIRISVTDTGIGIAPAVAATLFQPFQQADSATSRKYGGTGLGLAISKQLAEMMGGTITLRTGPGQGSTFSVTVQLEQLDAEPRPVARAAPAAPARVRLLLAEDNAVNQEIALAMLEDGDFSVTTVVTGREALAALERNEFDVVLMDCQMPEMDGFQATRALRLREQQTGQRRIPVIALTANAIGGDRELCLDAGMDDYVTKPYRQDTLLAALARWTAAPADAAHRAARQPVTLPV